MSIENSETRQTLLIGQDAVQQARRIGDIDQGALGATARGAALGTSTLPTEVFAAGVLAIFGGALGGFLAFGLEAPTGLGIVIGAGLTLALGIVWRIIRAPRRAKRQQEALRSAEATKADEAAKRIAEARESGAFDRFGQDA